MEIQAKELGILFQDSLYALRALGEREESRNGDVITSPVPMILTNQNPRRRVLFCKARKENPVFHLMECLWMMAGDDLVGWIEPFNPRMREFADGDYLHGAYGRRWRRHFFVDQILEAQEMLSKDHSTRRAVLGMWDPREDLGVQSKDLPCNTHIYLRMQKGRLNMTVCNRSNDLVWGALGSNVVHFSFLQELIAASMGVEVGLLYQFTNNLHIYKRHWHFLDTPPSYETYAELGVEPYPLFAGAHDLKEWLNECESFVYSNQRQGFKCHFFSEVATPIFEGRYEDCAALDWRLACLRYKERKENNAD